MQGTFYRSGCCISKRQLYDKVVASQTFASLSSAMDDARSPAPLPHRSDACCPPEATQSHRAPLLRQAFRLEYATIGWMVIEAAVALWSGLSAGSVSLLAFGIDSLIELASAAVLIWRLDLELRRSQRFTEQAERTASRIAGALLMALACYVVVAAGWKLATGTGQRFSLPGLVVTALAIPVMYVLARRKIAVADMLGSRAMRADAMESVACGWLSLVVVIGLLVQALTGAWWVDAVTSLGIVWFLIKESREAWRGECC
jgi:divalent metal cation (Fe/Co/Zn/Cd) transporter